MVTDIRMPPTHTDEGIRLANDLRDSHPTIGVVVLSQFADPVYALALFEHGSRAPRLPAQGARANLAELTAAIRAVAAGGSLDRPQGRRGLVARAHRRDARR